MPFAALTAVAQAVVYGNEDPALVGEERAVGFFSCGVGVETHLRFDGAGDADCGRRGSLCRGIGW